ncbi:hypothetical protein [Flavobacterium sp.]|uniref:DUF7674 family protein n=1 Tax=Flavobacterium sp. TaxID=239 RepID=UPI002616D9A8|nr:hypothetical protein [Flavobacterium sp.]
MKNKTKTIYQQAERFSEITKKTIISGNISRAKKLLTIAENLLINGSKDTKEVISTVYLYSVSSFMEFRNCSIANLFPATLRAEYIKQINATSV